MGDGSFCWFEDMLRNQFETLRENKTMKKRYNRLLLTFLYEKMSRLTAFSTPKPPNTAIDVIDVTHKVKRRHVEPHL